MELTSRQIKYLNTERKIILRIIEAKEKDGVHTGLGADTIRLQMIQLLLELSYLEKIDE